MFKNVKKLFLLLVLALLGVLVISCGNEQCTEANEENCKDIIQCQECTELNKENCKDYCDTCNEANEENCKDFVEKCPEINEDTCKDFINVCPDCIPANKENCQQYIEACPDIDADSCEEFFPYVAPTAFVLIGDVKPVGEAFEIIVEDFEPIADNVFTGLIWSSSDESIATVDANGVVTGIKPGDVVITAKSMLDPEVYAETDVTIDDPLADDYDIIKREQAAIISQLPIYAAASFDFPKPWNSTVEMKIIDENNQEVSGFVYPEGLTQEVKLSYTLSLKRGSTEEKTVVQIWAVLDLEDNSVNRLNSARTCAETLIKDYIKGKKVDEDLLLPTTIYGVSLTWDSNLPTILTDEGKVIRHNDDTPVTLSLTLKCGDNNAAPSYGLTIKGYSQEEKVDYIMNEGSLAPFNGKEVSTSILLPKFDSKFKAELSYVSQNPEVMDNNGKLLKEVTEKTEVKFTVKIDYSFVKTYKFVQEVEMSVFVVPANGASKAANEWLLSKNYDGEIYFPYGKVEGNVLDVPTTYEKDGVTYTVTWDISKAIVEPKYLDGEEVETTNAFELVDGKPKLVVQFLRYTQVLVTGTFANGDEKAELALAYNIGISNSGDYVYTGTWTSNDQKDGSLNPRTGEYDSIINASHFDKAVGYISRPTYGWGFWSGIAISSTQPYNGEMYQAFIQDYMYWEVTTDAEGNLVKNAKTLFNNGGDMGGNWGWLMHNTTDKTIKIEVGTYAATGQNFPDTQTEVKGAPIYETSYKVVTAEGEYVVRVPQEGDRILYQVDDQGNFVLDEQGQKIPLFSETKIVGYEESTFVTETHEVKTAGSRVSWAMDGYAVGFVADKDGNVLYGSGEGKLQQAVPYDNLTNAKDDPLFVGDSSSGNVYYLEVPAGGYAMSWKYQFYSGKVQSLYALCQKGAKLNIEVFGRHPMNSQFADWTSEYVASAQELIAKGGIDNNKTIETNLLKARQYYDNELDATSKAEVFPAGTLEEAEKAYAALLDAEIAAVLAKEGQTLPEGETPFVTQVGNLKVRLDALNTYISSQLTKKADFDAKYEELAKIELTVTLDYKGGYAMGYYKTTDFEEVIFGDFMKDLYAHMIEQDAWKHEVVDGALVEKPDGVAPTFEEFATPDYFNNNYATYANTLLTFYLFTAAYENGEKVENYDKVIPGSQKFFNTERGNKWIDIMNWVDEGTRAGNYGGQDAWGKVGEYYQATKFELTNGVQDNYAGNPVKITNSGCLLGAYRFAQYIGGKLGVPYKMAIPPKTYATICDRQDTQELYSTVIYHCTDTTVTLPETAYKKGAEFAGWFFEDGTPAVITGALFKDVTVYAKWNSSPESAIEKEVGKDLNPQYYGVSTDGFTKFTELGTINDQANSVGFGDYAVVVGDKLFFMPKYAFIELGKEGKETYSTKADLQVYGTDGTDQFSTGLLYDPKTDTVKAQNSYGHGALYYNGSDKAVTITDVTLTYGRDLGGTKFGYNRYVFSNGKAKLVGCAAGTEVVLQPGDYLWCPMTADRYCSGLTDCDGGSGVVGCLSDGCDVTVLNYANLLPKDVEWHTIKFIADEKVLSAQYLEVTQEITVPADPNKTGFNFLGWNTDKDATEGLATIPTAVTEDVTYYAIYFKFDKFDQTILAAELNPENPTVFTSLQEAIDHANDNGTVVINAGTYADDATVGHPVTIKGANAGGAGFGKRAEESVLTGKINVEADNVTFDGIKFAGATGTDTRAVYVSADIANLTVVNNVFEVPFYSAARYLLAEGATVNGATIYNNKFYVLNEENKATSETYLDAIRLNNVTGHIVIENNDLSGFYGDNYTIFLGSVSIKNAVIDIIANKLDGSSSDNEKIYMSGSAVRNTDENTVVNVKYNEFVNNRGSFLDAKGGKGTFNFEGNIVDYLKTTIFANATTSTLNVKKNYIVNGTDELNVEALATREEAVQYRIDNYGVRTIKEVLTYYAKAIKEFKGLTQSVEEIEAMIVANNATTKVLYAGNKQGVVDAGLGTLANHPDYATVFGALMDGIEAFVKDVNAAQTAWGSPWTGYLRIAAMFSMTSSLVNAAREQMVIDGLNKGLKAARDAKSIADMIANSTKVTELGIEVVNASIWSAYNQTMIYLNTNRTSGLAWAAIYADLNEDGSYTVTGLKKDGDACPVTSADLTITAWSGNAADYAILVACGVQVGDVIVIPGGAEGLVSGVQETALPVAIYRAN